jgi:vitamin B12 transporter
VITREDIERLQATTVEEVLRGVPGVSLTNNGGAGKASSVFVRGTNSDHVLVLINGVKTGSPTLGTTAIQDIPLAHVERIEVVRGPRSSLYGSEAIGGVIQIFTRKGGGELAPYVEAGTGSYHSYQTSAGVSGGGADSWYHVSAAQTTTNGFNSCRGTLTAGCFTVEPDDDGYRNSSAVARAGRRFDNGAEFDVHALRAEGNNQFDGSFINESKTVQQVIGAKLGFSPVSFWRATLLAGRNRDDSDNYLNGLFQTRFDSERDTLTWQNDFIVARNQLLTLGVDHQTDRIDSTTVYPVTSRDNTGIFAQHQAQIGGQDIALALRGDDNEQFGRHTTGSLAWGTAVTEGVRVTASYGTAFKAPTFNQLYFPGFGNPNLEPETSRTAEVGVNGKLAAGRWSLNVYETEADDLIAFDPTTFAPANIDVARIRGVEAVLMLRLAEWRLAGNLTWLDPRNRSNGANYDNLLPRRAQQALHIEVDRSIGRFKFGASVTGEGRRYDDLANTRELSSYALLDMRAAYTFAKHWQLQARAANVFDKHYETAEYYNQPGRNYFLSLRYQPGSN